MCARLRLAGDGRGRTWQLSLRRRAVRGDAAVPACKPLPLLALPEALGHVRADAGTGATRAIPAARGRGASADLPAAEGDGRESVLLRMRRKPVRRLLAGRRRDLRPPRLARRRPADPPAVPFLRRLARAVGRTAERRPPALRAGAAERLARLTGLAQLS